MRKFAKWNLIIISICVVVIFILYWLPEAKKEQAKKREFENLVKAVEKGMKTSLDEESKKYISISDVGRKEMVVRIWVKLLFEPEDDKEVKKWTDKVCKKCKSMFLQYGVEKDISVWAYYGEETKNKIKIYGRTFYSYYTGQFDFKKTGEIRPPKLKLTPN